GRVLGVEVAQQRAVAPFQGLVGDVGLPHAAVSFLPTHRDAASVAAVRGRKHLFSPLRGSYPMAEEAKKKPKIDLKARLGKKTISTGGVASIPPPVGMQSGSIPAPPFGTRPSAPQVDPSDPYAAVTASEAPRPAQAQAIRIEMSEEV